MSPRPAVDDNGRAVLSFAADLQNLSRTAALVEEIAAMHESGKWRRYETALGTETWKECEFDYFLISCDVVYDEIARVLAWNRRGKELAPAMMSEDPSKRRSLDVAAARWHSPTGESLLQRAERRGWVNTRGALRPPPIPKRARTLAIHGVTMDEHARQQRERQIAGSRRKELALTVRELVQDLSEVELRYVRDQLSAKIAARSRPQEDVALIRRDIDAAGGDLDVLAKKWGVTRDSARRRVAKARQ
jgi:hypothetical protein